MSPCPAHPEAEATGTCARCGRFYCDAEVVWLDLRAYCAECAVRPEVDWLGRHYRKLEGRRSGAVWSLAVAGLLILVIAAVLLFAPTLAERERLSGLGLLLFALASFFHFSGHRLAQAAPLIACLLAALLFAAAQQSPWGALGAVPLLMLAFSAWSDVPTRLFFRQEVPRSTLAHHYRREGSNPLAGRASRLAFVSLLLPGLGLISLVLGVIALTRVDPRAVPPITGLSPALGAIVFSLFTSTLWGFVFLGPSL